MKSNLAVGLTLSLLLGLVGGCWDEGDKRDCIGVPCPGGFQWEHGGELRAWYIRLPDGSELRRLYGIFIEDEDPNEMLPPDHPYTRPLPQIGTCAKDITTYVGQNPTYIDVGPSITFHLGDVDMEIPRQVAAGPDEPVVDFYQRKHEIAYLLETFEPTTPAFFNAKHSATTAEPQDFSDILEGLYMPPKLRVLTPENIPTRFTLGEDFLVEWEQEEEEDPSVVTAAAIVIVPFPPADAQPEDPRPIPTACIVGNSGTFTIPAETIDSLETDAGVMLVGTASNQAVLRDDDRMINMWGQNCTAVPWTRGE